MRKMVCGLMVLAGACGVLVQSQVELMEREHAKAWTTNGDEKGMWSSL